MIDIAEYEELARETGAYKDIELEILKEALSAWRQKPGDPYTLLELRDGKVLAGFAVLYRETGTEHSFDILAICVEPSYIGKSVADRLVALVEEEIQGSESSAILRFETSASKEAAIGSGTMSRHGFALMGHIPDFYAPGDDYFMYARHLNRRATDRDSGAKEGE